MIRPLTVATCLLACGSGLYLYQSKHEVQLLDRTIERTVHDTSALRDQSRLLAAEWTMLNDPERLRQFSDTYLSLKTIAPPQFTSLADLDSRLPAPQAEMPSHPEEPEAVPIAQTTEPQAVREQAPVAVVEESLPLPPVPAMRPAPVVAPAARLADGNGPAARLADGNGPAARLADGNGPAAHLVDSNAPAARPADTKAPVARLAETKAPDRRPVVVASTSHPVVDTRPSDTHPSEQHAIQRVAESRSEVRPQAAPIPHPVAVAVSRPPPAYAPVQLQPVPSRPAMVATSGIPASSPYGGSMLGMARGSMPPTPRPTPVSATYNSN